MVTLTSKVTQDSIALPGVTFTYRKMTEGLRIQMRVDLAEALHEARGLQGQLESLQSEEGEEVDESIEALTAALQVNDTLQVLQANRVDPHYLHTCFVSVNGLQIDDVTEFDSYTLLALAPELLTREIIDAIKKESALNYGEQEDLSSPTTSAAEVDGVTSDTIAENVKQ